MQRVDPSDRQLKTDLILSATSAALMKTLVFPIDKYFISSPIKTFAPVFDRLAPWTSIWAGNILILRQYVPLQALNFGLYYSLQKHFFGFDFLVDSYPKFVAGNIAAGALAGAIGFIPLFPILNHKIILSEAVEMGFVEPGRVKVLNSSWRRLYSQVGYSMLYRGFWIPCLGASLYRALYFGAYESLKPIVNPYDSFFSSLSLAYGISLLGGMVLHPFEVIRWATVQMDGIVAGDRHLIDNMRNGVKEFRLEWFRRLYRGSSIQISKALGASLTLVFFESLSKMSYGFDRY